MSDITVRDDNNHPVPQEPQAVTAFAPSALVQWAYEAREAAKIADSLSRTSFVPASLRGKPADITAAILAGQELGLQPMATLRSLDVIQGTPALRAHAMRGLVQSHGHKIQIIESNDQICRMRGRRKDEGDDDWQETEWTIDQAEKLGLLSKDQWKKQQKTMLVARCTGVICRLVAADVLFAMPYASEELGDDGMDTTPVRATARVNAQEVLANAAAARGEQPRPVSGPPVIDAEPNADQVWERITATAGEKGWDGDALEQRVIGFLNKPSNEADGFELARLLGAIEAGEVA